VFPRAPWPAVSACAQIDEICVWNGIAPIKVFDDDAEGASPSGQSRGATLKDLAREGLLPLG
jgi:hypothetical protein